jgi:hypothetical protein
MVISHLETDEIGYNNYYRWPYNKEATFPVKLTLGKNLTKHL